MTLIDDSSRKVWIYFLRTKDQAFEKFKIWKTMLENKNGKKVKKHKTDNGLEFCSSQLSLIARNMGL